MHKNELIAIFMGYKYYPYVKELKRTHVNGWIKGSNLITNIHASKANYHAYLCRRVEDMTYDKSWDDLIPVIVKIGEVYTNEPFIALPSQQFVDVLELPISTPFEVIYEAVVTFITLYNDTHGKEN